MKQTGMSWWLRLHLLLLPSAGKICLPLDIPDDMTLQPSKDEYRLGDLLGLNCNQMGLIPQPVGSFKCGPSLTWEPPLPADLRCSDGTAAAPTRVQWKRQCGQTASFCLLLQKSPLFLTHSVLLVRGCRDPSVSA